MAQRAAPPSTQASDLYQTAYIDFTPGNYNLAVAAFREYLKLYPSTSLAENAQFWIGESHFSLARAHQARGEADRAVQELRARRPGVPEGRRRLSPGDRVPAALYKEALALAELGRFRSPRPASSSWSTSSRLGRRRPRRRRSWRGSGSADSGEDWREACGLP